MLLPNRVTQNVITTLVVTLLSLSSTLSRGQDLEPLRPLSELPYSLEDLQDVFLEWPGNSATNEYASIDGRQMQHTIVEQQQISRRYRDTVNSQYWGRIIGASSDWESATWLEERFDDIGLSDVHVQPFDLTPQWFPQSWSVIFIGLDGHHNSGPGFGVGRMWLAANHETLFDKTALLINAEHPSTIQTIVRPRYLRRDDEIIWSNSYTAFHWYAGGSTRPELNQIARDAFKEFGISTYLEPNPRAPAGDLSRVFQFVPGLTTTDFFHYFHSDLETVETVPWTGLQNTTRAYARIR